MTQNLNSLCRRSIVKITRRRLLETLGASASTLPLSWSASARSLSLAGLIKGSFDDSAHTGPANSNAASGLDFTLNATPAWQLSLSGTWQVAKDPDNQGKQEEWFRKAQFSAAVDQELPNPLQRAFPGYNGVAWYWRSFDVPNPEAFDDIRIHFEGADYFAEAWLNSQYIGSN